MGKVYELQVGSRVEKVAADLLKPHRGDSLEVAVPPRQGRPPGTGGSVDTGVPRLEGGPVEALPLATVVL